MISCSKTKNNLCFTARYRGYYYDNETGYYYLQSRYYDPDLGRFISADDFSYVDTSHKLNVNAYSYCWNSPIALEDAEGTTPQISIDLSALQPLLEDTAELIKTGISKLTENIQKLMSKYNDFIDKLEFNINHPDVVINNGLSKILGREVSIKFPLINAIRAYFGTFDIRTGELVGGAGDGYHTSDSDNEENGIVSYSSKSNNSNEEGYGSDAGQAVIDLILLLLVYDEISIEMNGIFGEAFTESFFTLLNLTATIIPFLHNAILDLIKNVSPDIWDAIDNNVKGNISVESLASFFSTSFVNSILDFAEASFLQLFAVWGIGYFPIEIAVLFVGIFEDDSITPIQKLTLFFVDFISIIVSNIISIASSAFDFSGTIKIIAIIASIIIPIATDITTRILIKRR